MTETFHNPIIEEGADPFVTAWQGNYYYVYSVGDARIEVSRADNIHHLTRAGKCVFRPEPDMPYSKQLWAPEIHEIDGDWYLYVAADDGDPVNHRMYVLRSRDKTPDGEYEMIGVLRAEPDCLAIDGTVLHHDGKLYFVWSGWDEGASVWIPHNQSIFIAEMKSPTEIGSRRVLLSKPDYDWEKHGAVKDKNGKIAPMVNEGPQILYKDSTIHIVYSASHSMTRYYCLGLLTFRGGDILDPAAWVKSDHPVFSESEGTHGTGHCSFVKAVDGKTDFIIYHAMRTPDGGWRSRGFRAQPFTWDGDMPVFGKAATPEDAIETRFARPAHVVRGGSPTLRDRMLGSEMGAAAVEALLEGKSNIVLCEQKGEITTMDIGKALILDRMYKDKLKDGDLQKFDAETVAWMREFCAEKFAAFKKMYDLSIEISK